MPYFTVDEDGNPKEIPVKCVRSNDYKTYYEHGAQGGILSSYHFRVDFYRDDIPLTEKVIERDGKLDFDANELVIKREIDMSLYMSLPFAKQLRDWLHHQITEYEDKNGEILIVVPEPPEGVE